MDTSFDFDTIIVGAGIAGVGTAYRLQQRCPDQRYCLLESRHEIGGTWSLFKYPGIRSDSDLYTYSYPWRAWDGAAIARGGWIRKYIQDSTDDSDITSKIRCNSRVEAMSWSSVSNRWTLRVANAATSTIDKYTCRYALLATGYYDYDVPLQASIPGLDDFNGTVIHPQFWPKGFNHRKKNIVVIGSGATAITLVPTLANEAAHVTMLQRSPTYIATLPRDSGPHLFFKAILPEYIAFRLIRISWILFMLFFVPFCRIFPRLSWAILLTLVKLELPWDMPMAPNFTPKYLPFDQNLCLTPDSEFFNSIAKGKSSIKTGVIQKVTPTSIRLKDGAELHPDVIITATGLKLCFGGNINITVDGKLYRLADNAVWKGCMGDGLPNAVAIIGYFDASWTLGTDISAKLACRLINRAEKGKLGVFTPRSQPGMQKVPFTYLNATYVTSADNIMPKAGIKPQWLPRKNYWHEIREGWWGDITSDMEWC